MRRLRPLPATSALAALLLAVPGCAPRAGSEAPRAVILVVADGLGLDQLTLARNASRGEGRFGFEAMSTVGIVRTRSSSNFVTDSAAAATALASSRLTDNQFVGLDPEGQRLETITDVASEQGWRIGFVTNTAITHATPAGFYADATNRYVETDAIASDLLDARPDLALGGGWQDFVPPAASGRRQDERNLAEEARAAGFTVWTEASQLRPPYPDRLLGLFADDHLVFELDRPRLAEDLRPPTLEQLTTVALEVLGRDDTPFFLVLEAGRIDHAAHAHDAAGVIRQVGVLERVMAIVLEFQRSRPDTLVLLTADHATGGLSINDFTDWSTFERQGASVEQIVAGIRDEDEPFDLAEVRRLTGFAELSEADLERVRLAPGTYPANRALGDRLGELQGIDWIDRVDDDDTGGHTGEDVPLWATGPGAQRFAGMLDHVDIPAGLCELLDWEVPNRRADSTAN